MFQKRLIKAIATLIILCAITALFYWTKKEQYLHSNNLPYICIAIAVVGGIYILKNLKHRSFRIKTIVIGVIWLVALCMHLFIFKEPSTLENIVDTTLEVFMSVLPLSVLVSFKGE